MSGSAFSPLASGLSNGRELARRFAADVKCPIEPPSTMLHCLRQVPLQYFTESEVSWMDNSLIDEPSSQPLTSSPTAKIGRNS